MGVIKNRAVYDINHATVRTLVNVTGISHCLAKAIVNYRKQKQNHPIEDFHELWEVPGMTSEDFEAITETFQNSKVSGKQQLTKQNVKIETPKSENPTSKEGPTSSPTNSLQGPNIARNRRKRARKKKKKEEEQTKMSSLSSSSGPSSLKRDKTNSKSSNQRNPTGMNGSGLSYNGFNIPNLFVNPDWKTPQNTLILLTGGHKQKQLFTPYDIKPLKDGEELVIHYRNGSQKDTQNSQSSNSQTGGKQRKHRQGSRRSASTSPVRRRGSQSRSVSQRRSRSPSRSSKSTSPPEKRSRSNPRSKSDYSSNNVKVIDWGSVIPHGPGSSTLRSDITTPANEEWANNGHESVRNWLAGVRNENIIPSTGRVRSPSPSSTREDAARRRLDYDEDKPSTSAGKSSQIGQRAPNRFDGNYPSLLRDKSRRPSSGIFNSSKPLADTARTSQERSRDVSVKRQRQGRNKSSRRSKNRIDPQDDIQEDERRPIEARLDRTRDDTTREVRRAHKHELDRKQLRHRHRSQARAKSRAARWRRSMLSCSIM